MAVRGRGGDELKGERDLLSRSGGKESSGAANLLTIVGGLILIAVIAFGVYRMQSTPSSPPESFGDFAVETPALQTGGTTIAANVPPDLSPQARVASERYRCICGCNDPLSECTCTRTPGSEDMKRNLQDLVVPVPGQCGDEGVHTPLQRAPGLSRSAEEDGAVHQHPGEELVLKGDEVD